LYASFKRMMLFVFKFHLQNGQTDGRRARPLLYGLSPVVNGWWVARQLDVWVFLEGALNGAALTASHNDEDKSQEQNERCHSEADVEKSYRPDASPPSLITQSVVCKQTYTSAVACCSCREITVSWIRITAKVSQWVTLSNCVLFMHAGNCKISVRTARPLHPPFLSDCTNSYCIISCTNSDSIIFPAFTGLMTGFLNLNLDHIYLTNVWNSLPDSVRHNKIEVSHDLSITLPVRTYHLRFNQRCRLGLRLQISVSTLVTHFESASLVWSWSW